MTRRPKLARIGRKRTRQTLKRKTDFAAAYSGYPSAKNIAKKTRPAKPKDPIAERRKELKKRQRALDRGEKI